MEVREERPPNYEEIAQRFSLTGNEVFAWGGVIYNPGGGHIDRYLAVHEQVHSEQQREYGGPEQWWDYYLEDSWFRTQQEVEAYQHQYRAYLSDVRDRNKRARYLEQLARDLSSPMYGRLMSLKDARKAIRGSIIIPLQRD